MLHRKIAAYTYHWDPVLLIFYTTSTLLYLMGYSMGLCQLHPRRPRGSQSGREKRRDESFQIRAKEPLGTDSNRTISKNSSGCRLLIGHKKCFVLLCPIGEQLLLSSFRVFVHDGYCLDHGLSGPCTKEKARSQETFSLI